MRGSAPQVDVAILGGGFSGLACARRLALSRRPGLKVMVVEGRDRVGGRSFSVEHEAGGIMDLGGAWVGPTQPLALDLVQALGLGPSLVRQTWPGADDTSLSGLTAGFSPPLAAPDETALGALVAEANALSLLVEGPPMAPHWTFEGSAERAAALDARSAADFVAGHEGVSPVARSEFALLVQTVLACDPAQVSLLSFLFFVRACGGLEAVGDGDGGAQTFKLACGSMAVADRLEAQLLAGAGGLSGTAGPGVAVHRGCVVAAVDYEPTSPFPIVLRGADGAAVCAARVLVAALSPVLWRRLRWDAALMPAPKRALAGRMISGRAVKVWVLYRDAFWEAPQPGQEGRPALEDCGPVANLFTAAVGALPALVGLVTAQAATDFAALPSDGARRRTVLEQLERYFGDPAAGDPVDVRVMDWQAEALSGGCFAGVMPPAVPGAASAAGATLESPVDVGGGLVAFASTELAASWPGYFEGALDSGYRAAAKVGAWLDANA